MKITILFVLVAMLSACIASHPSTNSPKLNSPKLHYSEARKIADTTAARARHGTKPTNAEYHVKVMWDDITRTWSVIYYRLPIEPGCEKFSVTVKDSNGAAQFKK